MAFLWERNATCITAATDKRKPTTTFNTQSIFPSVITAGERRVRAVLILDVRIAASPPPQLPAPLQWQTRTVASPDDSGGGGGRKGSVRRRGWGSRGQTSRRRAGASAASAIPATWFPDIYTRYMRQDFRVFHESMWSVLNLPGPLLM